MAACGSLRPLFEKPLPENPTLIESLSAWNQIKTAKPVDSSSFTEIFGELHFKEKRQSESPANPPPVSPPTPPPLALDQNSPLDTVSDPKSRDCFSALDSLLGVPPRNQYKSSPRSNGGFSPKNSESLQLCTEGLGFESSDDVEDSRSESGRDWSGRGKETVRRSPPDGSNGCWKICSEGRSRSPRAFPPPISCIGSSGKPWVCFRSYRQDGRFVLREIRIPTQEFLHASREDGRLKLHFVQPEEDIEEGGEEREGEEKGDIGEQVN